MSSNMIKAYSIAYDTQKIRKLDMEVRENELEQQVKKLVLTKAALPETDGETEFVQGLMAEDLGDVEAVQEELAAAPEVDLEALKNSLREEIMAEMQPILDRKGADIISNAKAQAEGILEAARKDAELAKEGIFKTASAQGYEEGSARAKAEQEKLLAEAEARKQQLEEQYKAKVAELEPDFVKILTELVKKVTNVAYENHKEVLLYLIETGLGFAQKDRGFDVILNEEDYKKYAALFPKIKEHYSEKYTLEFKKSAELPEGSCKLENENRVIDCGLGVRLNGLLEELSLLGIE